jgi:hypothetical protein
MDPQHSERPSGGEAYWFPAKRYGWGWGPPVTWQGWVVVVAWLVILLLGLVVLESRRLSHARSLLLAWTLLYVVLMSAVLVLVCYWKGEPPRWRWGDRLP